MSAPVTLEDAKHWQLFAAQDATTDYSSIPIAAAMAILEMHGDKPRGPWITNLDQEMDLAVLILAFMRLVKRDQASDAKYAGQDLAEKILGYSTTDNQGDIPMLSLVDRARIVDAIATVSPTKLIRKARARTVKALADIVKERVTIKAINELSIKVADGKVQRTIVGAKGPAAGQGLASMISFTEEALGDDTQVNIPAQYAKAPTTNTREIEIVHNLTGRTLVVARDSTPAVTFEAIAGRSIYLNSDDLINNHVLTVKKTPATT